MESDFFHWKQLLPKLAQSSFDSFFLVNRCRLWHSNRQGGDGDRIVKGVFDELVYVNWRLNDDRWMEFKADIFSHWQSVRVKPDQAREYTTGWHMPRQVNRSDLFVFMYGPAQTTDVNFIFLFSSPRQYFLISIAST